MTARSVRSGRKSPARSLYAGALSAGLAAACGLLESVCSQVVCAVHLLSLSLLPIPPASVIDPSSSLITTLSLASTCRAPSFPRRWQRKHHRSQSRRLLSNRRAPHARYARNASKHTTAHHDLKHPSRWLRRAPLQHRKRPSATPATMSAVAGATMPAASAAPPATGRKASAAAAAGGGGGETKEKEKRYKCQFCNRAFSRSEHRSRHERSRKYTFLMDGWWGSARSRRAARDEQSWRRGCRNTHRTQADGTTYRQTPRSDLSSV